MFNRDQLEDVLERAAWTFIQAFAAAFFLAPVGNWRAAAVGGFAAGVSALKNLVKSWR